MLDLNGFELFLSVKGLSEATIKAYLMIARVLERECESYTEQEVKAFLVRKIKATSHSGANKYIKVIRLYCQFQKLSWGESIKKLKEQPKPRILLSDKEISSAIEVDPPPSKYGMFWKILAFSGARPMEVAVLRRQEIDLNNKIFYVGKSKTGAGRKVIIHEMLMDDLREYLFKLKTDLLFPVEGNPKKNIKFDSYRHNFKMRLEKAGIRSDASPYSFRHSFITNTLGKGALLFAIQDQVGHKNANTTRMYYHEDLEIRREAVEKLPLGIAGIEAREILERQIKIFESYAFYKDDRFDYSIIREATALMWKSIKKKSDD